VRCLTPRSSRAPTAKRQGRATVQVCFYCSAALAFYCRCRLSSNVRPRGKHQFMHLPASSPVFMNTSLRSPCRLPAVEGSGWWRSRRRVRAAFRRFSNFDRHSLRCEGASRQQPASGAVALRCVSVRGFKALFAHRSRLLSRARGSHSWLGGAQSASPSPRARQLRVQGRWLRQSRSGTERVAQGNFTPRPSQNRT